MKEIEIDSALLSKIRSLSKERKREIGGLIRLTQEMFGTPHAHSGVGLRDLGKRHYEVRDGLGTRFIFENRKDVLYFKKMGNHDEIRRFLKGL